MSSDSVGFAWDRSGVRRGRWVHFGSRAVSREGLGVVGIIQGSVGSLRRT